MKLFLFIEYELRQEFIKRLRGNQYEAYLGVHGTLKVNEFLDVLIWVNCFCGLPPPGEGDMISGIKDCGNQTEGCGYQRLREAKLAGIIHRV